jgi:hypothetical protein
VKGVCGATLQTLDDAKAASFGITSNVGNWKLFSVLGTKDGTSFKVTNASIDLDQYFDGALSYKTRAIAIEPSTGREGAASLIDAASSGIFTITPVVEGDTYTVQFQDEFGSPIRSISLDESGSSGFFRVAGTTFDPDEVITFGINSTTFYDVQSRIVGGVTEYKLVHKVAGGLPTTVADLSIAPQVTLTDGSATATFAASTAPLNVTFNEIASKPLFASNAPLTANINDGQSGLKIALPVRTNSGDDAVLYRLEGVPAWLTPSASR